jgi:hypothetical protein
MTKQHNDYYTYAYLREDKTPYYIGKGRGNRIRSTNRAIKPPKDKSRIIFLKKNLTEAEAFKHEVYMIFVFGRKDSGTGILRNRTNGGDGVSGLVQSAETRKKIGEASQGNINALGTVRTAEHKKKMSEANSGENNPMFGVPHTEETRKKQSEAKSGEKHPRFGLFGALNPCSKAIIAIEPDGTQRHYGSITEAARDLEIDPSSLCGRYLKPGKQPKGGKFKGWQFLYENP